MVPTSTTAPMARIVFHVPGAPAVFASTAEAMAEGRRDGGDHEAAKALKRIVDACWQQAAENHAPLGVVILAEDAPLAREVLATCLDNSGGTDPEADPERESSVFPGDVDVEAV